MQQTGPLMQLRMLGLHGLQVCQPGWGPIASQGAGEAGQESVMPDDTKQPISISAPPGHPLHVANEGAFDRPTTHQSSTFSKAGKKRPKADTLGEELQGSTIALPFCVAHIICEQVYQS